MSNVAAVILAAGEGKRFGHSAGQSKLTAQLDGKPLVRHVAEAALASEARPVLLVTGHAPDDVLAALDGLALERLHNGDPGAGLSGSLKLAVAALPKEVRGAVILLGDMPRVAARLIDRLVEAFEKAPVPPIAVVPVRAGRRGNPVLISRALFAAIETLQGDKGARDLIAGPKNILELPVSDDGIVLDVNTQDDLHLLRNSPSA